MKQLTVALAGNPNVGKSTVFNALTGLRQHTGNWPGKTVELKTGVFALGEVEVTLVDVPGCYSLAAHSPEEAVAAEYLTSVPGESGEIDVLPPPDGVVVVCDGCQLERNLILASELARRCPRTVVCVNLMDEAEKKGIVVDTERLSERLGCPVIPCAAREKVGLSALCDAILEFLPSDSPANAEDKANTTEGCASCDKCDYVRQAEAIAAECVRCAGDPTARDRRLDRIFTGRWTAYPVMGLLLFLVLFLTIRGAGGLSAGLTTGLGALNGLFRRRMAMVFPEWAVSFLCDGVIGTTFTVVAVMLPPMAIFFPLFTLLEDSGYLPRGAFIVDRGFKGCGACGKQALTMMMGFGCNAAGVTGCRIIDSPRERLIAMLTNALVPCNGRFSILLTLLALLSLSPVTTAGVMVGILLLSAGMTFAVSLLLSKTVLRGERSSFALELPPYRRPKLGQVLVRSLLDRTVFVLLRAVTAAAPAGALIWLLTRVPVGEGSLYGAIAALLEPIGRFFGMDGVLLCAFLFAFPAAELMLPLAVMGYSTPVLTGTALLGWAGGFAFPWSGCTVICVILFTLFHWPCATTLMTIYRETGSGKWTALSAVLPTVIGLILCALVRWICS